jgi:Cd2+/Zn2+-exporting ATPase
MAAAVERRLAHPLAHAVVAAAAARGIEPAPAAEFQSANGRGARGVVDGRRVALGNRAMFGDTPLPAELEAALVAAEGAGRTAVLVGWDGVVRGAIVVADEARPEARAVIADIRRRGIAHTVMLTGDVAPVAQRVAAATGVSEVRAGLLPQQKLEAIDELLAQYGAVAMVGDGVNDAPALARATLGVAMGAAGSDSALETADVALLADDLSRLPDVVGLGRATQRVIVQNVVFALAVKIVFLLAALAGVATLWMAVLADTGAALVVIANGMRLLRYDRRVRGSVGIAARRVRRRVRNR